jgi:hypothetical protein
MHEEETAPVEPVEVAGVGWRSIPGVPPRRLPRNAGPDSREDAQKEVNTMGKVKDVYELALIAPILRSTNLKMVRARARASREKFERHCRINGQAFAVGAHVKARITRAEDTMAMKFLKVKA